MRARIPAIVLAAVLPALAQLPPNQRDEPVRLPDGRSQTEAILKADYEKSLKDAGELERLVKEVKMDLEKNDRHVLSIPTLKKLDEIEKITRRMRSRMKRF